MPGTQEVLIKGWNEGACWYCFLPQTTPLPSCGCGCTYWSLAVGSCHTLGFQCLFLPPSPLCRALSKHLKPVTVPCGRHEMGRCRELSSAFPFWVSLESERDRTFSLFLRLFGYNSVQLPGLDSSLCFFQPSVSHDVLRI